MKRILVPSLVWALAACSTPMLAAGQAAPEPGAGAAVPDAAATGRVPRDFGGFTAGGGLGDILAGRSSSGLTASAIQLARRDLEPWLTARPPVPVPRDPGGGVTHERHKDNYRIIRTAGALYAITGERAYLELARDILLTYADLYPGLPLHPVMASQQRGRLFWQSLNDCVWLVESIQGYAYIRDALAPTDRQRIESQVLRPMADFLSVGTPATFRRIHNHGTWAAAAVGMTGYVIGARDLVDRALLGLDGDRSSGFLKQLDTLWSPDGYYAEGPYYQRYALKPFLDLARMIELHEPGRQIFAYRDGVLVKAISNLVQMSHGGLFFPINDSIREKGVDTPELVAGAALAYALTGDRSWIAVARLQGRVDLSPEGLMLGQAADRQGPVGFDFRSLLLRAGGDGTGGALGILRGGPDAGAATLVFEATTHGMEHGHYDQLSILLYDRGREVLADYGAARYLNVVGKAGGRYLPENESWASQTVAHNALVVDGRSQHDGQLDVAEASHSRILHFDGAGDVQLVAAEDRGVYPGIVVRRATGLVRHPALGNDPVMIDLVRTDGGTGSHQFDLPLHYKGVLLSGPLAFETNTDVLRPLGNRAGYQHLWERARAPVRDGGQIGWFNQDRFYTYSFASSQVSSVVQAQLGAQDPNDNLRPERALILRASDVPSVAIAGVLEMHGQYSAAFEYARDAQTRIRRVRLVQGDRADLIVIETLSGTTIAFGVSWEPGPGTHSVTADGIRWSWSGFGDLAAAATPSAARMSTNQTDTAP